MAEVGPGSVIGRYRVERTLGRGAFGEVYLAWPLDGGAPVALKVMHERLGEAGAATRRFHREAELVRELRHPNIVRLLDVGQTDQEMPFIAFELLTGRTLRQELGFGTLPPARCVEVTLQVLSALCAAHAVGVIHRDIKPENIFLCMAPDAAQGRPAPPGAIKVLDFGIAKFAEREGLTALTETGQMLGTPQYMPPEQIRGEPVDARSDLYALGVVMAEMVTGKRLVPGDSHIDIFMSHISDEPFAIPEPLKSSALGAVVARAVSKRPDERFADAAAMAAALEQAGARLPASLPPPSFAPLPPRTIELRPTTPSQPPRSSDYPPTEVLSVSQPPSWAPWSAPIPTIPSYPPLPQIAGPRASRGRLPWVLSAFGVAAVLLGIVLGVWLSGAGDRARTGDSAPPSESARTERRKGPHKGRLKPQPLAELEPKVLKDRIEREGYTVSADRTQPSRDYTSATFTAMKGTDVIAVTLIDVRSEAITDFYRRRQISPAIAQRVDGTNILMVQASQGDAERLLQRLLLD